MGKPKNDIQNIKTIFSRNVKRLRALANISQKILAEKAGLTPNFINDIETGKKWVSAETIGKLSRALRAEPCQFFLAEAQWNSSGPELFALYMEDLSTTVQQMVGQYRERFLAAGGEAAKAQTPPETPPDRRH
jgi:transcriptional regulator with XRE-family HTH domain